MALTGNASVISNFLANKGLSAAGIAGVLGTWQAESGLNPSITNSIGAHGLAQWLGSRRTALQGLASRMGSNENDITVQLNFFWQELQSYPALLHLLQTTSSPQQAAQAMVSQYERPGPGGDASAPGYALTFYNGGLPGGSGNPSASGGGGTVDNTAGGGGLPGWLSWLQPEVNAVNAFADIIQFFVNAAKALAWLMNPSHWFRIGAFLVGLLLFGIGIRTLIHSTGNNR